MSIRAVERIQCPGCGAEFHAEIWRSVCITIDREVRELLFDARLNWLTCSDCQLSFFLDIPFIYNDPDQDFMVFYLSEGMPPSWDDMPFLRLSPHYESVRQKMRMRVVRNIRDLVEKVLIFDAGLDDRVLECLKQMLISPPVGRPKCSDSLFFNGVLPSGEIVLIGAKAEDSVCLVPPNGYPFFKDLLEAIGELKPTDRYLVIDAEYARPLASTLLALTRKVPEKRSWLSGLFQRR